VSEARPARNPAPRPRIGITTYPRGGERRLTFTLPAAYVDAVRAGGGLPLLLPPGEDRPEDLLDGLDGVVFGGGGDLDPALFGGRPHAAVYGVDRERDLFELALMRAALDRRLPLLAICRGLQLLNVVRGGTLHAHLPDAVGEETCHRDSQALHTHHPVRVAPDSRLAGIYGRDAMHIASWHHQAVERLGRDLRAVAWAPDGTVEAVEDPARPELLAVQWHPELDLDADSPQRRLLCAFVALAGSAPNRG
jgi:putative glutamine amidotransferase